MGKSVRLADIAKKVGVSTVTVSKALSGQKGVSDAMRDKIMSIADELGYHRSERLHRDSAEPRSYNIGVLIAEKYLGKYDSFYFQLYQQAAEIAMDRGSYIFMEKVMMDDEKNCVTPRLIADHKADGLIVIGKLSDEYLNMLEGIKRLPTVYLDFSTKDSEADAVISNSYYGSYYLTNHLFNKGHEKIGFVGTILATESITDRFLGYTKSLMEHGKRADEVIQVDDRDINTGEMYSPEELVLPSREDMPTGFVCNCDLAASVLIKRLRMEDYRVPEDISICGYDNYLYQGLCDIPITTYEVNIKEMAKKAVSNVIHKIEKRPYHSGLSVVSGCLIEKESVRDIKKD